MIKKVFVFSILFVSMLFFSQENLAAEDLSKLPVINAENYKKYFKIFHFEGDAAQHPTAKVTVPDGYKVIGGGARVNWEKVCPRRGNLLTSSYPSDDSKSWIATSQDHTAGNECPCTITVWAIAIWDPKDLFEVESFSDQTPIAESHPSLTKSVPPEYVMTCGGAQVIGSENMLTASFPENHSTWKAMSKDHRISGPAKIKVYAIGIKLRRGGKYFENMLDFKTSKVKNHPIKTVSIGKKYVLSGGGARANWANPNLGQLLTASYPNDSHTWRAKSKEHIDSSPASITVFAIGIKKIGEPH